MPQVKIGPKLFQKEKSMYRDWVTSIARENIQNSVDAGATHIDIKIEDDGALKKVTFSDNGPGMDLKTLETVYFVLGETTKSASSQSVGGFGVARMLTAFAQEKYTLRTRDIHIEGCGAEWTPEVGLPFYQGVVMTAWIDPNAQDIQQKFESYLRRCHVSAKVTLNGTRWTEWTYRNKFERELSFGSVYTNKSKTAGVFVRVNGVQMFSPYCSAQFNVVVEIDQTKSRQVLQANRDGLLSQYQSELESFVAELNVNKQSALREKRSKSTTFEGSGTFKSKRTSQKTAAEEIEEFNNVLLANNHEVLPEKVVKAMLAATPEQRHNVILNTLKQIGVEAPAIAPGRMHDSGMQIDEDRQQLDYDLFSVVVHDDTNNPAVRKVIDSYNPANFDLFGERGSRFDKRYGERRSFRAGVDKYKLLILWKSSCEFAIKLLQNNLHRGSEEISWGVGWIFSNTAQAEYKPKDGVNWLLLNPCNSDGTMKYSIANKRDLVKLLSNACHEICHIVCQDHDEEFANLMNDLLEEMMANLSEALTFIKNEKSEAEARLNRISASSETQQLAYSA